MVQATTPTFVLTLPSGINLEDASHIIFTIEQDGYSVSKDETTGVSVSSNVATVTLSQSDTVNFTRERKARIQLNWTYSDGSRAATDVKEISVDENLYKDVIA